MRSLAAGARGNVMRSSYEAMWLFVMFDLPVDSKDARRRYTRFRKGLLAEGFCQLQFSVYARYFGSEEEAQPHRACIRATLPPEGQVRLMAVTEKQFMKQDVFIGTKRTTTETPPPQMMLF